MNDNKEGFRPILNEGPGTFLNTLKFYGRMIFDYQVLTIYRHSKVQLPSVRGAVLDVGCGKSPYRFLFDSSQTKYVGIDIFDADKFDYKNSDVIPFDGKVIPFQDESFDFVLCTEVLEHVSDYQQLISEIYRVLKKGGQGFLTVPWSARFHYIPYDYFRYTPTTLSQILSRFQNVVVKARGSDLTSIAAKVVVCYFRTRPQFNIIKLVLMPLWLAFMPIVFLVIFIGHLSLWCALGSEEDPLGYTVMFSKM